MSHRIAFIGSRVLSQHPREWVVLYLAAVLEVARNDCTVVTGAAIGADQLAAETAVEKGGRVLLVLPWEGYEYGWWSQLPDKLVSHVVYDPRRHNAWTRSVCTWHPAGQSLGSGAVALHARNYGIVEMAHSVIALPGVWKPGGTGQGMRIARMLGTPLFDLTQEEDRERLMKTGLRLKQ